MQIAIAGAGVAGLASAILLARQGHEVTVFDHIADPTPVGAGILLQPTGQAVLQRLGLLEQVLTQAAPVHSLQGHTGAWHSLDLNYAAFSPHGPAPHGLGIHRASLHGILWQAALAQGVQLRLGVAVDQFSSTKEGVYLPAVASTFFDALIIANGTRSRLRESLPIKQSFRPYPWGAFWTVLDAEDWPFPTTLMQRYRGAHVMLGVLPTGRNPLTQKTCYSIFWSLPCAELPLYLAQGMTGLSDRIEAIWPEVAACLRASPHIELAMAQYADVRMQHWHHENILVIGDAAHAMSPQLGQGANMALVDAWHAAQCLARSSHVASAWADYSQKRAAHIRYYQMASRAMTPLYQSHYPVGFLRDLGTSLTRRIPTLHRQTLLTLSGAKQGWLDTRATVEALLA